jgi:hypothetical protein
MYFKRVLLFGHQFLILERNVLQVYPFFIAIVSLIILRITISVYNLTFKCSFSIHLSSQSTDFIAPVVCYPVPVSYLLYLHHVHSCSQLK